MLQLLLLLALLLALLRSLMPLPPYSRWRCCRCCYMHAECMAGLKLKGSTFRRYSSWLPLLPSASSNSKEIVGSAANITALIGMKN